MTDTSLLVAQAILRLYQAFTDHRKQWMELLFKLILELYFIKIKKFSEEDLIVPFYQLIIWSATQVDLRLDEYGRTGLNAVRLIFLISEIVLENTAWIWPLDEDNVLFLSLSMEELAQVWIRIYIRDIAIWNEDTDTERKI